jgi:thiamine transporter ThiT
MKLDLRELVQISLLLAAGFVLRLIIPGYGAGMKPDVMLIMLFIIIFMKKDFSPTITAGIVAGMIAALTTSFPAGQLPNIIDKPITSLFVLGMVKLFADKVPSLFSLGVIGFLGTVFSGSVFLLTALLLSGIPAPFMVLFTTVVLPAAVINTVGIVVLYPLVTFSKNVVASARNA